MPTPEYHAQKSPSSAHRWISCPFSYKASLDIPKTTSIYAEAGRLAHSIAELKARKRFMVLNKRSFNSQLKKLQESEHYAPEMNGYTDIYVETLEQHAMSFQSAPFIALEVSVPIGTYTGELKPDGSPATGTADCIQIAEDTLWVSDYKNGSGVPVSAENNPQMMIYALGALTMFAPIYGDSIKQVRTTIIQPALKSVSDWSIGRDALQEWGHNVLTPAARKADGDDPGDPNPGEWCKFCPIRNQCRGRAYKQLALEAFKSCTPAGAVKPGDMVPQEYAHLGPTGEEIRTLLSDAEVGNLLTRGAELVAWYNDLKEYALSACLKGKDIAGYKVVAGRGSREWDNLDAAFADLQQRGVAEALLWERKPVSVAGLEKAIGRKTFAEVASDHVETRPGKPTLAPESDSRPVFNAAEQAFTKI